MSVARRVNEILDEHVTLTIKGIDRMYWNVYIPRLRVRKGWLGSSDFMAGSSSPHRH
jgi:hypothetical protein